MKNEELERESLLLEIQSRKEVLKKIENAYKRLKQQAEANYEKRKAKIKEHAQKKSAQRQQRVPTGHITLAAVVPAQKRPARIIPLLHYRGHGGSRQTKQRCRKNRADCKIIPKFNPHEKTPLPPD